ncbi:hypothetical protein JCM8202v2_001422 [Rhodotorula sphaerocarpa]
MDPQFGTAVPPSSNGVQPSPTVASSSTPSAQPQAAGQTLDFSDQYVELAARLLMGYQQCEFADFQLQFTHADGQQSLLSLHALVVSRLRGLLSAHPRPPMPVLSLTSFDTAISTASLALVLASLYSPAVLSHVEPDNAPSVLATAVFFGLNRLADLAFRLCEESVAKAKTPEEIATWVAYVDRDGVVPHASGSGLESRTSTPLSSGAAANGGAAPASPSGSAATGASGADPAGATSPSASSSTTYEGRLRSVLLSRILRLPSETGAFSLPTAGPAQAQLIEVLKPLPFDLFKRVIEDSKFAVPSDMDRFNFAKKVVAARKQHFLSLASPPGTPGLNGAAGGGTGEFEEAVVMQFGSGAGGPGASAVNVLRKPRKPTLWKVSNAM